MGFQILMWTRWRYLLPWGGAEEGGLPCNTVVGGSQSPTACAPKLTIILPFPSQWLVPLAPCGWRSIGTEETLTRQSPQPRLTLDRRCGLTECRRPTEGGLRFPWGAPALQPGTKTDRRTEGLCPATLREKHSGRCRTV